MHHISHHSPTISQHALSRCSQRGIKPELLQLAYDYGTPRGDKLILNKKDARQFQAEAKEELRLLKARLDQDMVPDRTVGLYRIDELKQLIKRLEEVIRKSGIVAVIVDEVVLTNYRLEPTRYH